MAGRVCLPPGFDGLVATFGVAFASLLPATMLVNSHRFGGLWVSRGGMLPLIVLVGVVEVASLREFLGQTTCWLQHPC